MLKAALKIPARILILLIWIYRNSLSLVFPNSCRYQPTCSQYAIDALNKYGFFRGTVLAARRIGRCHPYSSRSGYDPA